MTLVPFLLDPFAEPLLDHALVIEVSRAGEPLDTGEHPRIEAERDRGRLARVGLEQ